VTAKLVLGSRPGVIMKRRMFGSIAVAALLAWVAPHCGGDSESGGAAGSGATDASSGGGGGPAGGGGQSGAGGSSGSSGNSGSTSSGGSGGCVATDCPDFQSIAPGCCRPDGTCGYDGSALGGTLGCVTLEEVLGALEAGAGDAGDPNCPDFELMGFKADGCCLATGFCGLFDPILTQSCIDPETLPPQYKPDTGPPVPCGPNVGDASVTDAGAG
jgi:hypothetical protein